MASPAWSICARPPSRYIAPLPRSYVFTLLHEDHSPVWRRWAECLGFNVMPRQHELAARACSPSQQELAARADTSSQHELATRARTSSQHAPTRALSTSWQHELVRARSTSQLEPSQHELAARASSSRATSELEHGTRLASLFARLAPLSAPLPHHRTADGALAALSGSSVQFTIVGFSNRQFAVLQLPPPKLRL